MAGMKGISKPNSGKNSGGAKHKSKRSPQQRTTHRVQLPTLMAEGWTQREIAAKFGVSQEQVSYDWKIVLTELRRSRDEVLDQVLDAQLAKLAMVQRRAWDAWERSKVGPAAEDGTPTERPGDPRYLQVVLDCVKKENDLHGLNPQKRIEMSASVSFFDVLAGRLPPTGPVPDEVEEELRRMLGHTAVPQGMDQQHQTGPGEGEVIVVEAGVE